MEYSYGWSNNAHTAHIPSKSVDNAIDDKRLDKPPFYMQMNNDI